MGLKESYPPIDKYVALADTNETALWTPSSGKRFVVTDIIISAAGAGVLTLRDGVAGTTKMVFSFAANGGCVANLLTPLVSSGVDKVLTGQTTAATQYILLLGHEE